VAGLFLFEVRRKSFFAKGGLLAAKVTVKYKKVLFIDLIRE
jgi:hypothetical protein